MHGRVLGALGDRSRQHRTIVGGEVAASRYPRRTSTAREHRRRRGSQSPPAKLQSSPLLSSGAAAAGVIHASGTVESTPPLHRQSESLIQPTAVAPKAFAHAAAAGRGHTAVTTLAQRRQ